jgi:CubicO group peptidase (beta-lactamase class C family)
MQCTAPALLCCRGEARVHPGVSQGYPTGRHVSDPAIDAVEAVVDSYFDTGVTPGLSYGVVEEEGLAHAGGRGRTGVDERTPDADSVFRIASMTKSFTAAAVLILRDEGRLVLDMPVEDCVPELAGLAMPTADSPRLTVRHLLTMSGGLPTDDAWGDRQESLTDEEFGELMQAGFRFDSTPGTQFEYSNLGFAILGRVVANLAGESYRDFVTHRLLQPVGLTHSVFDSGSASPDLLVRGHRRVDDEWQQEEFDTPGAFSPIGGLYSSVADLTRWVSGLAAAFPARDDPPDDHPLRRASRREMQQQHRSIPPKARLSTTRVVEASAPGYGFGLFVDSSLRWGTVVSHPGGYPGFGSCMCWHPASGLGVVMLANSTYAKVSRTCRKALEVLLQERGAPARTLRAWPESSTLRRDVGRLLADWDDARANRVFAVNMDLDVPRDRRRADVAHALESVGGVADVEVPVELEAESPSQLTYWLQGRSGRLRVHIGLTPQSPPKIQTLTVEAVPDASADVVAAARSLVAAFNGDPPSWPGTLPAGTGVDVASVIRLAVAARALDGPFEVVPGAVGGDGDRTATFKLSSGSALWQLAITVTVDGATVEACELTAVDMNEQQHTQFVDG